jgi:hypothetical protein
MLMVPREVPNRNASHRSAPSRAISRFLAGPAPRPRRFQSAGCGSNTNSQPRSGSVSTTVASRPDVQAPWTRVIRLQLAGRRAAHSHRTRVTRMSAVTPRSVGVPQVCASRYADGQFLDPVTIHRCPGRHGGVRSPAVSVEFTDSQSPQCSVDFCDGVL